MYVLEWGSLVLYICTSLYVLCWTASHVLFCLCSEGIMYSNSENR